MKQNKNIHQHGTLEYFRVQTWKNLTQRCANSGAHQDWSNPKKRRYYLSGIKLLITKEQFYKWCELNWKFISEFYQRGITPSIDRINSKLHYTLENIRVISHSENSRLGAIRSHHGKKNGES
ncbi:MAG: hypothetical protein ACXVB4_01415 [Pseudobdellovibrionaceae bacterium]